MIKEYVAMEEKIEAEARVLGVKRRIKAKAKGARSEHKTIKYLTAQGYACTKAGGSLGAWDVIAIGADDVQLVQVKSNAWPRKAEMTVLENFVVPKTTNHVLDRVVKKVVHRWRDGQKLPDVREL